MTDPPDSRVVYVGSNHLWRTLDFRDTWRAVSPNVGDSPIAVIEQAAADQNVIYIGTENGGIFRTLDFGVN